MSLSTDYTFLPTGETSLVTQRLRFSAFTAEGPDLILSQGSKILKYLCDIYIYIYIYIYIKSPGKFHA